MFIILFIFELLYDVFIPHFFIRILRWLRTEGREHQAARLSATVAR